jgi:hypothetical protein
MHGPVTEYLALDHQRLDHLLTESTEGAGAIDVELFQLFRKGLLRHIGMEEKILFPAARRVLGAPVPGTERLRADHSRIVALLVPTPTPQIVDELKSILVTHDAAEEGPDGVYAQCERLLSTESDAILSLLRNAPEVPVRPHFDGRKPKILTS